MDGVNGKSSYVPPLSPAASDCNISAVLVVVGDGEEEDEYSFDVSVSEPLLSSLVVADVDFMPRRVRRASLGLEPAADTEDGTRRKGDWVPNNPMSIPPVSLLSGLAGGNDDFVPCFASLALVELLLVAAESLLEGVGVVPLKVESLDEEKKLEEKRLVHPLGV